MAAGTSEMPLLTSVDQSDIFAEGAFAFRMDGCYYADDELHPYDVIAGDTPIDYDKWEEEVNARLADTYDGVYIDDITKQELFSVLLGRGGYFMLKGSLEAADGNGPKPRNVASPDGLSRTIRKTQRQIGDIETILNPLLEAAAFFPDETPAKIDGIIEALRVRYSGEDNKSAREKEVRRLNKLYGNIGQVALRRAA